MAARLLPVILLFFCTVLAAREEYRYDVLMAGTPAGEILDIWEETSINGQCVVRSSSDMHLTLTRGASELTMSAKTVAEADCGTYRPRTLTVERNEGGGPVITKAWREGDKLLSTTEKNGIVEKGVLQLDTDAVFFGMLFRKYPHDFFLKKGTVPAISEEGLVVRRIPYEGHRAGNDLAVEVVYEGIPISLTVHGAVAVNSVMSGGLIEYRLRGTAAPQAPSRKAGSGDVLAATAIENTGIAVKQPRRAARIVMTVENAPAEILDACYQTVSAAVNGARTVTIDRSKAPCPGVPIAADTAATLYEDKDAPAIVATAAQWKGIADERMLVKKIIHFVYDHITDKNYRNGTLSASETLAARSGDCTEHAVLAAALLKARGIPVRMAYGLVLSDDGRFFFHNWLEVHAGDGWIPADPTFDQFPADAARLLIVRGGSGTEERENLSLAVIRFLQGTRISVTGFSHD